MSGATLCRIPHYVAVRLGQSELLKVFFKLECGGLAETVFMQTPHMVDGRQQMRNTVCVSSQLGCRRSCSHCVSGHRPFQRDLTCSEMLGQVAAFAVDKEIHQIVFQGMGEPLDNPAVADATSYLQTSFRELACSADGGQEHCIAHTSATPMTCVATAGSIAGIERLRDSAPTSHLMLSMMPHVDRPDPLEDILECTDAFARRTGNPVALSYTMIDGLDTARHAEELLQLIQPRRSTHLAYLIQYHENLDGGSPVPCTAAKPSSLNAIRSFSEYLQAGGCTVGFGQYCQFPTDLAQEHQAIWRQASSSMGQGDQPYNMTGMQPHLAVE